VETISGQACFDFYDAPEKSPSCAEQHRLALGTEPGLPPEPAPRPPLIRYRAPRDVGHVIADMVDAGHRLLLKFPRIVENSPSAE